MKRWTLFILLVGGLVYAGNQQTIKYTDDIRVLTDQVNQILTGLVPANGGDGMFWMDRKNKRIGLGTKAPTATVSVSTSSASTDFLSVAGSFQTLPTTGYRRGTFAYQLSDNKAYCSTETVTGANSWKSLW